MKIKSLEELKKIREEHMNKVNLRNDGEQMGDNIEILVGMATCGISSGAREILNEFVEETIKRDMDNVKVVSVGCIGYCHSEPTVQVNIPGQKPIVYGKVTKSKVYEILNQHIKEGKPVEDIMMDIDFERVQ